MATVEETPAPSEIANNPSVAYVFAFLWKFSPMAEDWAWPSTAELFEEALTAEAAPADDYYTDAIGSADWTPNSMQPVLTWLHGTLHPSVAEARKSKYTAGAKTFLARFVDERKWDSDRLWQHQFYYEGNTNKLTGQDFWSLSFEDRIAVLHVIVDHCLAYATSIRDVISEQYNLLPQRVARRTAAENPLVVEPLGRDKNKFTSYQLDDSARIYKAGNPYRLNSSWEAVSTNQTGLDDLVEEIENSPIDIKPASPAKSPAVKKTQQGEENRLLKRIEKDVLPSLIENDERLQELTAQRLEVYRLRQEKIQIQQATEEAKAKQEAAAAAAAAVLAVPRETLGRRAAAKRVDYKAIEDGKRAAGDGDRSDSASTRSSKRARRSRGNDDEYETGSPDAADDYNPGVAKRTSTRGARSSRRLAAEEELDPVAEVAAYEAKQRKNQAYANGLRLRPYVPPEEKLPEGANPKDYDLNVEDDYEIYAKGRLKIIKGAGTARAECQAQQGPTEEDEKQEQGTNNEDDKEKVTSAVPSFATRSSTEPKSDNDIELDRASSAAFSEGEDAMLVICEDAMQVDH